MDNKLSNSRNYELEFGRPVIPYRAFATWNIHYACNYKCTYCHAPKPWHENARKGVCIASDKWIEIWKKNYERYGTWEILISGGEPFAYPDFMELVFGLSQMHLIGVCTNLEWDVAHFVKRANPERIRIETSFHPEFADLGKFVKKLKLLKESGFSPTVNFVPWPPLLDMMQKIKESVESSGCQLTLQPFIGNFENRQYPQGYTEKERQYFGIFNDDCNLKTLNFKTTGEADSTKGRLCRMGQNYVFIHPDGEVSRCCRDHTISLGNIIDGSFNLLEEPLVCQAQSCNCWRCMLVEKENSWWQNWGRYEITALAMKGHSVKKADAGLRISLIQAPVWGVYDPPAALAQLSSCLKKRSFVVSVFDLNIELYSRRREQYNTVWAIEQSAFWANNDNVAAFFDDNSEAIENYIEKIVESAPDLIGFSVNICSLPATMQLASRLKKRMPQAKIVIGGPMFFVHYDAPDILKHDCIDAIVLGEGEEAFCELAEALLEGKDSSSCKGIWFKKDGRMINTQERSLRKDLDELPFLDLKSFPLEKYDPPGHLGRHISLMTSRGCVLNCAYCGPKSYWRGFRFMSGKRIFDEVRHHLGHNPEIEHIEFLDLELNGNMKSLIDFCDLMIAQPPKKGIRWHANIIIRPEMSREVMLKMKEAGCVRLSIGIETGSQRILDLMRKRYKIEDAQNVLKYAYEAGIHVTTNFMFGFPGESEDDFKLTLDFLRRNAAVIGTVYPSRSFFTIEPNSYIADHMDEFEIIPNADNNLYWESADKMNDYPERLRRCEEFSRLASELGVHIGLGLQTSIELDRYYNLGFYYESKKDFKKAGQCFKEYLNLDPKNSVISRKLRELSLADTALYEDNPQGREKPCMRGQVSFNWDITYICSYRCPYCWFYGKWQGIRNRNINIPLTKLAVFWQRMYEKYGEIKIAITGGEPFLYPGFTDLINTIAKWHKIEIVTNLCWPVESLSDKLTPQRVQLHPSFHPLFADSEDFIRKLIVLKSKGFAKNASYVAWPPQIPLLRNFVQKFKEEGLGVFVQSFFGEHNGVRYPEGYSDAEREIISPFLGERGGESFQITENQTKGKLCYAGVLYGVIHPDGSVLRCGGLNSGDKRIGNILDDDFKLLDDAYPCASEICPCNEWAFLLKK